MQIFRMNYSYLQHQYKSLLQRHTLLLSAFKDVKSVTFDEYISAEADKVSQPQVKAIQEETETRIEALQNKIKELLAENKSAKEINPNVNNTIFTNLEEIEKLEARIKTSTMDIEKSFTKIQELETAKDVLDKAVKESIKSLSAYDKKLQEEKSQYEREKKKFETERKGFRNEIMMLNEKLEREKKENVRNRVQPRNNTPGICSAVFRLMKPTASIHKFIIKTGLNYYRFGLDINIHNVVAVVNNSGTVYLYSETTQIIEELCVCQYDAYCLAWNQQGTLLAIGGRHNINTTNTIQIWDIPNRQLIKRLKMKKKNEDCMCLDWKRNTIIAGTGAYMYQWNIKDLDDSQDCQGNQALLPTNTRQNKHASWISSVQWSSSKSKLATITFDGNMCIYDEHFNLIHHTTVTNYSSNNHSFLQWCPWDDQVIATGCRNEGYLTVWRIQQDITLIKKAKHESDIYNIKWIPGGRKMLSAHENYRLVLWDYPSLNIIQTMKGHTGIPRCLALNAGMTAMVSMSENEIIFWKSFDQFEIQSANQEGTWTEEEETTEEDEEETEGEKKICVSLSEAS